MLDNVKTFKNGNMSIYPDQKFNDRNEGICALLNELTDHDIYLFDVFFEDLYAYNCAWFYNPHTDKQYCIDYAVIETYCNGKRVKLFACDMEDEDYILLNEYLNED